MNLSHVVTFQNEVRAATCVRRILTCAHFHVYGQSDHAAQHAKWFPSNYKGNIHCGKRGQPSHAAVEGEGRIILHQEPNQKQLDDSFDKGLRTSGRRRWFIIYEQD